MRLLLPIELFQNIGRKKCVGNKSVGVLGLQIGEVDDHRIYTVLDTPLNSPHEPLQKLLIRKIWSLNDPLVNISLITNLHHTSCLKRPSEYSDGPLVKH